MRKELIVLIAIAVAGFIYFIGTHGLEPNGLKTREVSLNLPAISLPTPGLGLTPVSNDELKAHAWATFQQYLQYAKDHNLEGIKSIAYQISPACQDPAREAECFSLMDSLYLLTSNLAESDFNHIESDARQIILYSDTIEMRRIALYFTRDTQGEPKVLGMRLCVEEEGIPSKCVASSPSERDLNSNGWWDNVESLFYKPA